MKYLKRINGNTFKFTTIASTLLFITSLLNNYVLDQPGPRFDIDINGNGNKVTTRDFSYGCPNAWTATSGLDPHSDVRLVVCESPDDRYVITVRDGHVPEKVFDSLTGTYLPIDEVVK